VSNWTFQELQEWDEKICKIAKSYGLDWYPVVYEVCDYYEMIGHMSYHGMPSHYHHWSYGKSFERTHQEYNAGATGLPYELIINSDPSIAYLMRENPLYLQILIMAHCLGHSDFFKNNVTFGHTNPKSVIARMRAAKKRIQSYIEDPSIGIENVERVLDAAHAISFNTERYGRPRKTHKDLKAEYVQKIKNSSNDKWDLFDIDKIPLEPDYDVLGFMVEHGRHLEDWEKDLISVVRDESIYFMPQMRTKIMNEGWASFWHYKIMQELDLPSELQIPFLKSHNQVVRPFQDRINPYHMGFYIFKRIEEEQGLDACFFAREVHHDESAIREFIDEKACRDLGLYSYSLKRLSRKSIYQIDNVPDEEGWKSIREDLVNLSGINRIPRIYVEESHRNGDLTLRHEHDGRDLELDYADQVVRHISSLWEGAVRLFTIIEDDEFEI
jgi:stage V sporulation protein R